MAYNFEEVIAFKNFLDCDSCGEETLINITEDIPLAPAKRQDEALGKGFTVKGDVSDATYFCPACSKVKR